MAKEMSSLIADIQNLSLNAVKFDNQKDYSPAIYYYRTASSFIQSLQNQVPDSEKWIEKAKEYTKRAEDLSAIINASITVDHTSVLSSTETQTACFLMTQALDFDEKITASKNFYDHKEIEEAIECYTDAVQCCLDAKKSINSNLSEDGEKLAKLALKGLERAEILKSILKEEDKGSRNINQSIVSAATSDDSKRSGIKSWKLSAEEKYVLASTSVINDREYPPFLDHLDFRERFASPIPFTDKHGLLKLSEKQRKQLHCWARPHQFIPSSELHISGLDGTSSPCIIKDKSKINCLSVRQTIVSDCSFVASIVIAAQYERRFGKPLISSLIFPKNRKGESVYNPCGKYMISLHVNGVKRKIIIDDLLPVDKHNNPLCSHSINRCELWVSLLEKAYLKVMGGYDFPGSNSNIDLYALTGWIPERVTLVVKGSPRSQSSSSKVDKFDEDAFVGKLMNRFHRGDVLVTFATGEMSDRVADRAGLVPTHAYAMLDIRVTKSKSGRDQTETLFLLKNPWAHLRWRGNFSEIDTRNWSSDLKRELSYDPLSASNFDDGIFWIDLDSLLNYFDIAYLNWNALSLFPPQTSVTPSSSTFATPSHDNKNLSVNFVLHGQWKMNGDKSSSMKPVSSTTTVKKDLYNISNNPQFLLNIDRNSASGKKGVVWILLTRHITTIEDFRDNSKYITLLVYKRPRGALDTSKSPTEDGEKQCYVSSAGHDLVYYPFDPPPHVDGIRINSPHYLCQMVVDNSSQQQQNQFNLVISQFEQTESLYYTLRVYSTFPFDISPIKEIYRHSQVIKDKWCVSSRTAGGCGNNRDTYTENHKIKLTLAPPPTVFDSNILLFELKGPKEYQVGFEIIKSKNQTSESGRRQKWNSGAFRSGFSVLKLANLEQGEYTIIPSTFKAGCEGPFIFTVKSSNARLNLNIQRDA